MPRNPNTDRSGNQFLLTTRQFIWNKTKTLAGYSPEIMRVDICGHTIRWSDYGDRSAQNGWEIDHVVAVANGGTDDLNNLQALYWGNNAAKSDKTNWRCGQ